jgi:hypothetical protein
MIDAGQGVKNFRGFKGRGRRGETSNDKKKEVDVKKNSQPKSLDIPYHTKTIATSRRGTMTYINCKDSKPRISGQIRTIVKRL